MGNVDLTVFLGYSPRKSLSAQRSEQLKKNQMNNLILKYYVNIL